MDRQKLLDAINKIKPGISSNSIVEQSDLILFDETRLVSYNDEVAVSVPFESGIKGGIPSTELAKLLQKLTKDEIEVSQEEDQLVLKCGNTKAGLRIQEVEMPPLDFDSEKIEWHDLPKDFADAIKFCLFSAATDISKGVLTCLLVSKNVVASCDNYRLSRYEMSGEVSEDLLIPNEAAKTLFNHRSDSFAKAFNWIHFDNSDEIVFSCRMMDGEYPDISKLFDVEGEELVIPKELKDVLARTEILASDTEVGKKIMITLSKGKMTCRGESIAGWVTETINAKYAGKKMSFEVDPLHLSQILDHADIAKVSDSKIRFDGEKFIHVIALVAG